MSKSSQVSRGGQARARRVPRLPFICTGPSRAKQSFRDECDINSIMRRFEKTGVLEHVSKHGGRYGDFIGAPEYHEACNRVLEADAMFQELPAKVRKRFSNDPADFLAFMADPENQEEARQLGLLKPLQTASEAPVAPPAPTGAPGGPAKQGAPEAPGGA